MKKIYLSALLLAPLLGQAQDLDQNVTATAGAYSENATGSLSWTIGETMVESVSDGTNTLTQGFHQGNLSVSLLINETELGYKVKVYPNPVTDNLSIETTEEKLDFQLLNINGQVLKSGKCENRNEQIDFTTLPQGTYILKLNNNETHKIIKH
jgi:opacity protein-like surface antigen